MRLVQLRLKRARPFWIMSPIRLTPGQPDSPFLNIDMLNDDQKDVINLAAKVRDITLFDATGRRASKLEDVNYAPSEVVDTADVLEPETEVMPEMISVTVDMDIPDDNLEEEDDVIPEEVLANALILLKRNGNTVKASLAKMPQVNDTLMFLHACLQIESDGKQRTGVTYALQKAISEY